MVNSSRVAIIGAGSVGASIAFALLLQKISSEILLVDIVSETVEGQCDIVVITAGAKQKSGESRVKIAENATHSYVLGEHGDSQIIAWSSAQVGDKEVVAKEIASKAYKIIELKGVTYFGIAGCVSMLVQCIVLNQKHIRPLSTCIKEYDCVFSMPVVLGSQGVERVIDISLSEEEKNKLRCSASTLKSICAKYL
ncbi:17589_t:CDS:2 [Cetraspora pellucida]|uniref:17588_t:CDS:1 n=2 Tax=Cetraspora pellucida TaxID=1433469 RepID=A0ACA9K6S6_9GLOM|nr:17588_t:CDS:2 [Cetraspora pellucida]CAG8456383.1 17589_t:CDS:2 [Cetraspora pellucida]